jgi:two-component system, NarL family, response regulator NreC
VSGAESQSTAAEASAAITIVLADDHEVVRAGLRMLLEAQDGLEVVAEAGDIQSTIRQVAECRPRVLVLDVNLPDGFSLSALPRLRSEAPGTQVVILTMHDEISLAREALRDGAAAFVQKASRPDELIRAVRAAAEGRVYLPPDLAADLATDASRDGALAPAAQSVEGPRPHDLSAREIQVLRLIALGHTNAEVAGLLYLSVRTVESHRAHIQQKIQRSSRADLVAYARWHGVL